METIKLEINDKEYNVLVARTEEEKECGLQDVIELEDNEGMLFLYDSPQTLEFWMHETSLPLDIIFIDEDWEVKSVQQGKPFDDTILSCNDVQYVLELNQGSGVKEGDEVDVEDDELNPGRELQSKHMEIYGPDGKVQAEIVGGERIISIVETKVLVRKARKATKTKKESDYKSLGRYLFNVLKKQDEREPEYVSSPDENKKGE